MLEVGMIISDYRTAQHEAKLPIIMSVEQLREKA